MTDPITPPLFYSKYKKPVDAIIPGLDGSVSRSCVWAGVGCINTRAGHEPSRSLELHNHKESHNGLVSIDF